MSIIRSVKVNASAEKIYSIISDFNHWVPWSPWLIMEPGVEVNVAEDSKYYDWNGKRVGSGNMKITSEVENQSVQYDLVFLKPWKSKAKVSFSLTPESDETLVTWTMDSSLPFFMFWMKKMMEAFVGMDYERGLNMLKDYSEDGKVHSALNFNGEIAFSGGLYVGIEATTTKGKMPTQMGADFGKLWAFLDDHKDLINGMGFSMYKKWDMVRDKIIYLAGVQVKSIPSDLPQGMVSGEIPATKVHQVEHIGPYAHLGNAWSAQYMMQRNKEFKMNKKIFPFEVYQNIPGEVDDKELITQVNFAVK